MHDSIKGLCYEHGIMFDEERLVSAIWSQAVETSRGYVAAITPKQLCEMLEVKPRQLKSIRQRVDVPWLNIDVRPYRGWVATFDKDVINNRPTSDQHLTNTRQQADEQPTDNRPHVQNLSAETIGSVLDSFGIDASLLERLVTALSALGTGDATRVPTHASGSPASSASTSVDDDITTPSPQATAAQQPVRTPESKNQPSFPDAADDQNPNVQETTEDDANWMHEKFAQYGFDVAMGVCKGVSAASKKPFKDGEDALWMEFVDWKISRFVGTTYPLHVIWDSLRKDGKDWRRDALKQRREDEYMQDLQQRAQGQQHQPKTETTIEDDEFEREFQAHLAERRARGTE